MKNQKKLPGWLIVVIDLFIIAVYVGGFYGIYYKIPRQLESDNQMTTIAQAQSLPESNLITSDTSVKSDTTTDTTNNTISDSSAASQLEDLTAELSEKYAQYLTSSIESTDHSYTSDDSSINVEQYTMGTGKDTITYYVADIYLTDIKCLQSGFAENSYGIGYTDTVLAMDQEFDAILAINGDYYGNGENGVVIRNGTVYRSVSNNSDVCVLYMDGTMKTYSAEEFNVETAIAEGAWQAWCFGPELLDESGRSRSSFTTDGHIAQTNPRSAIGYYEPGHYCFVVVDGRQSGYSKGMTLTELSALFERLGCSAAYNLDGGKSSSMTFADTEVNQPCGGGRKVSDSILIKEVE
jgi:hypothetical protein